MKTKTDLQLEIFAENVHFLRIHYGYTKKTMASILGISVASLSKIESGTVPKRVGVSVVYNIMQHFNVTASLLFTKMSCRNSLSE